MSVLRCPQCGRTADGVECFACGHAWPRPQPVEVARPPSPAPARVPTPAAAPAAKGPPLEGPVPSHSNPFGVPLQQARAAAPVEPVPAPARPAAARPRPVPSPPAIPAAGSWGNVDEHVVTAPLERQPASVAAWVVRTVPTGSLFERLLRSPLGFVLSGGLSFLVVVGFGSLFLLGSDDPVLRRIDSGKAGSVIEELLAVPVVERTPRQYLLLGHAYARNGATPQALDAYREAAKRGGADRRALDYTLLALDHPLAKQPIEVLKEWQSEDVSKRLVQLTDDEGWHLRHNALKVLQARKETTAAIVERVAILDVAFGPDCDRRREGLHRLESLGEGDDAKDAIESLRDNYKENFCIPLTELDRAQLAVDKR